MKAVSIAGSTGSIGTQALEVIAAEPDRFRVAALGAARSVDLLAEQALAVRPDVVAIADADYAAALAERLPADIELRAGGDALGSIGEMGDVVVNGIVGFAGLPVTTGALRSGRRLALANKESLIAAGPVVQPLRDIEGAEIIPVDSEHCALHQCLRSGAALEVAKLWLTASGGPFRGRSTEELASVTVEDALRHPTWSMGPKITVDSSTLMNKGLEVIEAHELFGVGYDAIDVVVQPQSVIHSMVDFADGSTMAQLSMPDMRLPIGYALAYPERLAVPFGAIDWAELGHLDFDQADRSTFECLDLAYAAGRIGGTAPAWLSAANEEAVAAFLDGRIAWLDIAEVLKAVLDAHDGTPATSIDVVMEADCRARERAGMAIADAANMR